MVQAETSGVKKKLLVISRRVRVRYSSRPMASEDDYDSMEELALVQNMSEKIESGMESEKAMPPKSKARKSKAAHAAPPAEASLED